jgi:hypothetical protein
MVKRTRPPVERIPEPKPKYGPFRFSDDLLKDMAAYLSKERKKPISLDEANDALIKLTYFFKWLKERKTSSKNVTQ